jgi:hypothetical protein
MNPKVIGLLVLVCILAACQNGGNQVKVKIHNPSGTGLQDNVVEINDAEILQQVVSLGTAFSVQADGKELPFQRITDNGNLDKLLVLTSLNSGETKEITIKGVDTPPDFQPLTQAEISVKEGGEWVWVTKENGNEQYEYQGGTWKNVSEYTVPEQHTDHSFDIRYEGPGWESDKIGYRFYLDWRNAVDIFGKKVDTLVLQHVGLDGFDSYHEMSDWGVDVLKVGDALGIGSIGHWANGTANRVEKTDKLYSRIDYSGILESKITTIYSGWETAEGKTDLTARLSIRAGSYLTKTELELSEPLENICTGIVKHPEAVLLAPEKNDGQWNYLATFGLQTLQEDYLGMAVFYKKADLIETTEDELSHVVVLKPADNKLTYYFGAAWEHDRSQVKTEEEFRNFLDRQVELLNHGLL